MSQSKPIGQLLKDLGFITEEQIEVALEVQKANPKFLGETLEDLDFITSAEIAEAIALQHNLEYIDLENVVPSKEALMLVPKQVAISKNILPIRVDEQTFVVATQEINDIVTLDYLRKISKRQVKFVVGDKKAIARFTEIFYYQLENPIEIEISNIVKDTLENKDINIPYLSELIINSAIKDRATDIHIVPELSTINVFYRIDGVLEHYYALPKSLHHQLVARIKIIGDLDISEQRRPQDGSFVYKFLNEEFDLRISTLPTNYGENIVIRLLSKNTSLFSLSHLGLNSKNSQKIESYFQKPYGVILVVGPTGSGKTTTLYSALRKINSIKKNIMTIEDPIEYKFSFVRQTQLNERAGYTFDSAIRAFMRQDPDVMLIGEIRDEKTAELAIRASITGHLVLSTLHTNDSAGTIPRLVDLKIPPYLIGSGLLAVIAQRLVRKLCEHCKEKVDLSKEELLEEGISEELIQKHPDYQVYKPVGCPNCRNIGYRGRIAIVEILEIDKKIESMITLNASVLEIEKEARKNGLRSIKEDGYEKVLTGVTTLDEIRRVVN